MDCFCLVGFIVVFYFGVAVFYFGVLLFGFLFSLGVWGGFGFLTKAI